MRWPVATRRRWVRARPAVVRRGPGPRVEPIATRLTSGFMGSSGRITDEGVARLRTRIGIPEPHPMPPYYTLPTVDTFRNVAVAYGDDNPLWCDPEYGPKTRWEHPIASPVLVGGDTLIGEDEVTAVAPEHAELMKGDPLRGVH